MQFTELQEMITSVLDDLVEQGHFADVDDTVTDVKRATSADGLVQAISTLDHNDNLNVDGLIIRELFTRLLSSRSEEERNLLSLAAKVLTRYADECNESESACAELTEDGYDIHDLDGAIALLERMARE